ncbi:MAG: hypothetical protein GXY58_04860 [Planctomycetaceae bacterium]|nr:hypothetical protein [Planctomycetaceae bacterium]
MKRSHLIAVLVGFMAIVAFANTASAYYHPGIGRFTSRDPGPARVGSGGMASGGQFVQRDAYAGGMNLYQYTSSNPIVRSDAWGLKDYKIGTGPKPDIKWDNGFAYDPNAEWTWGDLYAWNKYGVLLRGAQVRGHLPNGTRAYQHYRDKTGTDLWVNYDNAIADDGGIDNGFKAELAGAQADIEREHDGKMQQFSVYSTSARLVNSSTEDWQKALGGHNIWGTGTVTYDPAKCTYALKIAVDMEDFYNFNKGQADIATGLPDNENGRFEVFGWAKSFYSRGQVTRTITWKKGEADKTTQVDGDPRRSGSGRR